MSDKFKRLYNKQLYGPLAQKSLHNILKRELMEQFGFENMGLIADALVARFLALIADYTPERKQMLPGQALWLAVAVDDKPGVGKPLWMSRLVPVVVTLVGKSDIERMIREGKNHLEIRPDVVARMLKEAYAQGGVLGFHDVALLLGISQSSVARAVRDWHKAHPDQVLPYRGTVHDMGCTTTHKKQAIELKLMGCLTQEIARRLHHDPESIDIYQVDFERVWQLHKGGRDENQIAFLTQISRSVVRQYIEIIDNHVVDLKQQRQEGSEPIDNRKKRRKAGSVKCGRRPSAKRIEDT